ncbi:hypothetical protein [Streptomyces sp. S.PB5]|uniref:hypothetical protein n=1 Tax=Streptomyces sp. S.PB5 TaxID=3020844 RepID=UPI0025AF330D|nr:hypothetical protein [Streptomyces sp. S.PB5]MDN3028045.1 hypothetical protein [Streptomyces sp. S.PB5]
MLLADSTWSLGRQLPLPLQRLRLAELHDEWQAFDRRYLSEASMAVFLIAQPTPPEPQITPQPESKWLP